MYINFLTNIIKFIAWAFGGSGPDIMDFINKKMNKTVPKSCPVVPHRPSYNLLCEIESDIKELTYSINYRLSDQQRQTFLRYYEKYKDQLQDPESIYKSYESITNEFTIINKYDSPSQFSIRPN